VSKNVFTTIQKSRNIYGELVKHVHARDNGLLHYVWSHSTRLFTNAYRVPFRSYVEHLFWTDAPWSGQ